MLPKFIQTTNRGVIFNPRRTGAMPLRERPGRGETIHFALPKELR